MSWPETVVEVKAFQRKLNAFTDRYLYNVAPLKVDGKMGRATQTRIKTVKTMLGYARPVNAKVTEQLRFQIRYPKRLKYSTAERIARGVKRRIGQRRKAKANQRKAKKATGVVTFDGRPCAAWLAEHLRWARAHGWNGTLTSGWRDPAYSESLCRSMCGAPSCPGKCAGRASNHSGVKAPAGAVDVSDYVKFAQVIKNSPAKPPIHNALGAKDPVHFSASGR